MSGFAVARLDEIPEIDDGRAPFRPVRHHFGIGSFGINAWTGRAAGDRIINEHDETGPGAHEELYAVLSGRATFEVAGETVEAPAGTLVFVERDVLRAAIAVEANTTVLALGGVPGEVYEPVGWELWSPLSALYGEGRFAEAADRGAPLAAAERPYAGVLYNLACCESLAGRTADAIEHLRRAVELSERFRTLAESDTDFDPIREQDAFRGIVGVAQASVDG